MGVLTRSSSDVTPGKPFPSPVASLSWLHLLTFPFPCPLWRVQQFWAFPGIRQFDLTQKCPRTCHAWEGILRLTVALGSISERLLLFSYSSNRIVQEWLWAATLIRRKDPLCPLGTKQALPSGGTDTLGEVHVGALGPPLVLEAARVRWWVGLELLEEHRLEEKMTLSGIIRIVGHCEWGSLSAFLVVDCLSWNLLLFAWHAHSLLLLLL